MSGARGRVPVPLVRPSAGDGQELLLAAGAALRAARAWRATAPVRRGRALLAVAAALEQRRAELVDEVRRQQGARVSEALGAVDAALDELVRWAGWADKLHLLGVGRPGPAAVVGVVVPHGDVLLAPVRAVAPVLAAGAGAVLVRPAGTGTAADALVRAVAEEVSPGLLGAVDTARAAPRELAAAVELVDVRWADPGDAAAYRTAAAAAGCPVVALHDEVPAEERLPEETGDAAAADATDRRRPEDLPDAERVRPFRTGPDLPDTA
ncbi:aldehyde dehydrogenase family protein [Kineococcus terrestris]|uniref:aldehyde dehydrogenase family protein n=1 Tax=Kineococcus terrestris TaxID=2044856 RepID=UPI0034DADCD0